MFNLCDAVFNPPARSAEENEWRSPRYDVHIGKIGWGDTPMLGINLEYVRPTHRDLIWFAKDYPGTVAQSCAGLVEGWNLNGMFLDTPFENMMPVLCVQLVSDIRAALGGGMIVCPNYGDQFTFMGEGALGAASKAMQKICSWAMCEVAVDLSKPFDASRWQKLRNYTMVQLNAGKTIILGINDPGGDNIVEAMGVMLSLQHVNIYWKYFCGLPSETPQHASSYCWHPVFEIARS